MWRALENKYIQSKRLVTQTAWLAVFRGGGLKEKGIVQFHCKNEHYLKL